MNRRPSLMSITRTELMTRTINPAPTKTNIKMQLRACGGSNWLWRWRYSVSRSRAQSAHSVTAPRSVARSCQWSRRSSKRLTNRLKSCPLLARRKPKTAATLAKTVQIPPARSRKWSRAKSSQLRLCRPKYHRAARRTRVGPPAAPAPVVSRCRAKGCRAAQRRLRTLHRRALAHQMQGTSPLH